MSNTLARCILATDSHQVGVLLYRIAFWEGRSNIRREGKAWVVFTHDQWMLDAAMSASSLDRALAKLRRSELVVAEHHMFGNRRRMFIRLSKRAELLLKIENSNLFTEKQNTESGVSGDTYSGVSGDTESGVPIYKESNKGGKKVTSGDVLSHLTKSDGKKSVEEGTEPMKVSDVLKAQAGKKILHKPDTVASLEFVWKSVVSEVCEIPMVHVTVKQKGQLKHFKTNCPPGTSEKFLEAIIRNWLEVTKQVQIDEGLKTVPSKPSIDFLLKYAQVAIGVVNGQSDEKTVAYAKKPGSNVAPSVQLISQLVEDAPKTYAELMAIIGKNPEE